MTEPTTIWYVQGNADRGRDLPYLCANTHREDAERKAKTLARQGITVRILAYELKESYQRAGPS